MNGIKLHLIVFNYNHFLESTVTLRHDVLSEWWQWVSCLYPSLLMLSALDIADCPLCALNGVKVDKSSIWSSVNIRRRHYTITTKLFCQVLLRDDVIDVRQPHTERRHTPTESQLQRQIQHSIPVSAESSSMLQICQCVTHIQFLYFYHRLYISSSPVITSDNNYFLWKIPKNLTPMESKRLTWIRKTCQTWLYIYVCVSWTPPPMTNFMQICSYGASWQIWTKHQKGDTSTVHATASTVHATARMA